MRNSYSKFSSFLSIIIMIMIIVATTHLVIRVCVAFRHALSKVGRVVLELDSSSSSIYV